MKNVVHVRVPPGQGAIDTFVLGVRTISRGRAVAVYYFPGRGMSVVPPEHATPPTNPFLRCQRLRASFLPRAFARDTVLAAAVPWLKFSPKARR
jgi:hypothetical protein